MSVHVYRILLPFHNVLIVELLKIDLHFEQVLLEYCRVMLGDEQWNLWAQELNCTVLKEGLV